MGSGKITTPAIPCCQQHSEQRKRLTHESLACYSQPMMRAFAEDGAKQWLRSWQLAFGMAVILALTASTAQEGKPPHEPLADQPSPGAEWLSF